MPEIKHILCPVDFSDASRHALDHAIVIARWYGSQITALYVGNPMILLSPPMLFADSGAVVPGETNRQVLEAQLRTWVSPAVSAAVQTRVIVDEGNPAACILEHARALPADLLVMGTHGRSGFERLVLGSVTERVLRKAQCPMLTVPPPTVSSSKLPFKQLLCPVDFSEPSISALQLAFSIAKESDARLTILHVFDWPPDDELWVQRGFDGLLESRREIENGTRRRIEALIPEGARNWCAPEPRLSYGKPYREVVAVAEAEHIDLIVMGVHGRNALDLMFLGSTTNQVVRQASCPVLTLRK